MLLPPSLHLKPQRPLCEILWAAAWLSSLQTVLILVSFSFSVEVVHDLGLQHSLKSHVGKMVS